MPCPCGGAGEASDHTGGVCHDCYKSMSPEQRRALLEKKLRGAAPSRAR